MAIDQATLLRLLTSEQSKLRAYTWQIVRNDHVAEEVLQDMAVVALQKCDQIVDASHFPAWARRTCRNLAMNAVRKTSHAPQLLSNTVLDLLEDNWEKQDDRSSSDLLTTLRRCVSRLTAHARQILNNRYAEGLQCDEVARRMGVKVETIYVSLMRTHKKLAACMEQERRRQVEGGPSDV